MAVISLLLAPPPSKGWLGGGIDGPFAPMGVAPALLVFVGILEPVEDRFKVGVALASEGRSGASLIETSW